MVSSLTSSPISQTRDSVVTPPTVPSPDTLEIPPLPASPLDARGSQFTAGPALAPNVHPSPTGRLPHLHNHLTFPLPRSLVHLQACALPNLIKPGLPGQETLSGLLPSPRSWARPAWTPARRRALDSWLGAAPVAWPTEGGLCHCVLGSSCASACPPASSPGVRGQQGGRSPGGAPEHQ